MTQDLAFDKFLGIRQQNGVVDYTGGRISALVAQNVEFYSTELGDNIGVRTIKGRYEIEALDSKYTIYGDFTTNQNNNEIRLFYVEDETSGKLLKYENKQTITLIDGLPKTGRCNGITMLYGLYDYFILTNGAEIWAYCDEKTPKCMQINAIDCEGRNIKGLSLFSHNQRLGIETLNRVHWSKQMDITNWFANELDENGKPRETNAAYEEFTNKITAIVPYINGIVAFSEVDSTYMSGNPALADDFTRQDASIGGTPCFSSVVVHDKYLFYFDHKQNNIYYFLQNDVGQKRTGEPVAFEIQKLFADIDYTKLQNILMKSIYADGKNEIWVIIPLKNNRQSVLVYDYLVKEWVERTITNIQTINTANNAIYTSSANKLYKENIGIFDGQSIYKFSTINMGSDTNLKIPKLTPTVTADYNASNEFYVQIRIDGKDKIKEKFIKSRFADDFTWGSDEDEQNINDNQIWDIAVFGANKNIPSVSKLPPIPAFKWLELTFLTKKAGQEFSIKRFEAKKIRTKTKTL